MEDEQSKRRWTKEKPKIDSKITWLTVRVRVHSSRSGHWPDRVRVIVKERGAIFFPFRLKVMSIPLYKNKWRQVGEKRWWNEQAAAMPIRLGALLQRAEWQRLALQLYCLRGCTVQHKALGCFKRLMQQLHNDELILELHYPGCSDYYHHSIPRQEVVTKVQQPPTVVTSSSENGRTVDTKRGNNDDNVQQETPCSVSTSEQSAAHTQEVQTTPDVTLPSQQSAAHDIKEDEVNNEVVTTDTSIRPIRFSDSGSVFAELLHEYDQIISQEQTATKTETDDKEQTDKKTEAKEAASHNARVGRTQLLVQWLRRLLDVATLGMPTPVLLALQRLLTWAVPWDITGGLVAILTVVVGVVVWCYFTRKRRPVNATRTHLQLPKERKCRRPVKKTRVKRSSITRKKRQKRKGPQRRASVKKGSLKKIIK